MKKTITVIIIALILIGSATFECIAVGNVMLYLENAVGSMILLYAENKEDISVLYDDVDEIDKTWTGYESALSLMFNHKDLSSITDSINKLKSYTKNNSYTDAAAELELLKGLTEKNDDIMGFNFHNVL